MTYLFRGIFTSLSILFFLIITITRTFTNSFNVTNPTEFQNALNTASSNGENDTINVAAGTYNVTTPLTYSTTGTENYSLTIIGAGENTTILDGGGTTQVLNLNTLEANGDLDISHLTFSNGSGVASGSGLYAETDGASIAVDSCMFDSNSVSVLGGGACLVSNTGDLTTSHSSFTYNTSSDDAGGLNAGSSDGMVELTGCTFVNNSATGDDAGGALLYAENGEISMTWNTFIDNNAADDGGGGFTYQLGSGVVVTVTNNTFTGNEAHLGGGGSFTRINDSGSITFTDNTFTNNSTITGGGAGTFIYLNAGNLTYTRNTYTNNTSGEDGGGAWVWSGTGTMNLSNSTFTENSTTNNGGGISLLIDSGIANFSRCVLDSNSAGNVGGGISYATTNGTGNLFHNTLYGNTASEGGGIYFYFDQSGATTDVYNTILWHDNPNGVAMSGATTTVLRYSDIENGTGQPWFGTGCIEADPLFEDAPEGDFHLTWTNFPVPDSTISPCIDTGDPTSPLDPDSTRADMGAFYFNQSTGVNDDGYHSKGSTKMSLSLQNLSRGSIEVEYSIEKTSHVSLTVYNIVGQRVETLVDEYRLSGKHTFVWETEDMRPGIYFCRLHSKNSSEIQKIIIVK
jgi:hypothetical protein